MQTWAHLAGIEDGKRKKAQQDEGVKIKVRDPTSAHDGTDQRALYSTSLQSAVTTELAFEDQLRSSISTSGDGFIEKYSSRRFPILTKGDISKYHSVSRSLPLPRPPSPPLFSPLVQHASMGTDFRADGCIEISSNEFPLTSTVATRISEIFLAEDNELDAKFVTRGRSNLDCTYSQSKVNGRSQINRSDQILQVR